MRDVSLLVWLRVRHARWTLDRIMHLAGAGIEDGGWSERAYQLYAVGIMLVWFALMAAALVDAVATAFAGASVALCAFAVQAALIVPAIVLVQAGIGGVRRSPLKLSHPDIAYLAASSLSARALVGTAVGAQILAAALGGGAGGLLLGIGLESALALSPALVALAGAVLVVATVGVVWVAGILRLASVRWSRKSTVAAALVFVALSAAWIVAAASAGPAVLLAPATFFALGVGGAAVFAAAALALALLSPRVDMTRVIDENSLHADLCRFGALSPLDRNDIAEYQRRRKLAERPVRFSLARGEGRRALVARSVLSHARRYDGIPLLAMQGAVAVPLGVLALMDAGGIVLFVFWLQAAVMFAQGAREATRTFREDVRNRLVRDRLPFGTLELLALDALPAFALTSVLACAASLAAVPAGASALAAAVLAVLVNAALLLSCGLDAVRLFPGGPRLCYEYGALALVGTGFALALFAPLPAVVLGVALVTAGIAAAVRFGPECAR